MHLNATTQLVLALGFDHMYTSPLFLSLRLLLLLMGSAPFTNNSPLPLPSGFPHTSFHSPRAGSEINHMYTSPLFLSLLLLLPATHSDFTHPFLHIPSPILPLPCSSTC
ncbi:unnamed protein product [Closterium sp. NIES-54]